MCQTFWQRKTATIKNAVRRFHFARPLIIWPLLSILLVGISVYLTWKITFYDEAAATRGNNFLLSINFDDESALTATPIVEINGKDSGELSMVLHASLNKITRLRVDHWGSLLSGCQISSEGGPKSLPERAIMHRVDRTGSQTQIDYDVQPLDVRPHMMINQNTFVLSCRLNIFVDHVSFASRRLVIGSVLPTNRYSVLIGIEGAEAIEFRGGGLDDRMSDLRSIVVEPGSTGSQASVVVAWKNERSAQIRDVILVVIGGLVGLAFACLVELVKASMKVD